MSTPSADGTANGSGAERLDRILAVTREVLRSPGVAADDDLADHGGTSLSVVRIVAVANRTLHLDINPRELGGTVTARDLARVARPLC
ncbi:acyl carrier protein [Sphaerisporangium aureirubrum]|uniref:Acyl carrier protein n=1 Tax=Sphaerisporangium aureirubrum TaxID=1544736 RepID=A0ABW1NK73_9ACTN